MLNSMPVQPENRSRTIQEIYGPDWRGGTPKNGQKFERAELNVVKNRVEMLQGQMNYAPRRTGGWKTANEHAWLGQPLEFITRIGNRIHLGRLKAKVNLGLAELVCIELDGASPGAGRRPAVRKKTLSKWELQDRVQEWRNNGEVLLIWAPQNGAAWLFVCADAKNGRGPENPPQPTSLSAEAGFETPQSDMAAL